MRAQRGKKSQPFWASRLMRKWLNIKPKLYDFSEDEFDMERKDNDDSVCADDSFFEVHGDKCQISKLSGERTIPAFRRLQRRKSETIRVNYISSKDVRFGFYDFIHNVGVSSISCLQMIRMVATRVMIGTWNVAGRTSSEDIDLDQWLCTQEPADIYVLGFQEVVPLTAGNVLGTEDSRPIRKWEAIIRQTLNNSQRHKKVGKSYSAPVSPLLGPVASRNGHEYTNWEPEDEVKGNLTSQLKDWQPNTSGLGSHLLHRTSSLDWPEHPLDTPSNVMGSGKGLRRVMSLGLSGTSFLENIQGLELQDEALQVGIRRQYCSSGNLGMLWAEEQEKIDVLNSLDCISDCTSEEGLPSVGTVEESATVGKGESAKRRANYVRIASKQMVGIYVSVWVSRKLRCHVNNLEIASVGVGLLGYMGNKGSISISMSLFQTRLCFVCSHLASGHNSGDKQKRNSDVDEILQRTRFSSLFASDQPQKIPSHDRIFWFGDLNYRIDLPDAQIRQLVAAERWDDLLKYDQVCGSVTAYYGWGMVSNNSPTGVVLA
ncbi:hypothetical protein ACP70R_022624 [Stipagrostis hirtigluma subsp. patula]